MRIMASLMPTVAFLVFGVLSVVLQGCGGGASNDNVSTTTIAAAAVTMTSTTSTTPATTTTPPTPTPVPATTTHAPTTTPATTTTPTTPVTTTTPRPLAPTTTTTPATPATTTTPTTPTLTTTVRNSAPTPGMPMSGYAARDYLNRMYMGFDEKNDKSPLGITMTLVAHEDSFWKNIFCSTFTNPVIGKTGCNWGRADCRMSASLYNHKMLVSNTTGAINLGLSRHVGIVFNQTMTENHFGKCSYIWDGATDRRMNTGCGAGAPTSNCTDKRAAFYDQCDGHRCTVEDHEVTSALCVGYMGGRTPIPACHECGPQCAFPGPALNYHQQEDWTPTTNHLRDMAKARVKNQVGNGKIEEWNEVVIDENLLMPKIWSDPSTAIPAIVYKRDAPQNVKANAYKLRDEFCRTTGMKGKIPVLAVDANRATNPFSFEADEFGDVVPEEMIVV